jgi:Zn-dependent protease
MNIFDRLMNPLGILYSLPGIILGLVLHELAHAVVADRLGDPTPRRMGRISLNPMHHLDIMGFIMLIVAGFGWAKPVMTDPRNYRTRRFGFALVGIAGPLTNLLLGLALLFGFYAMASQGWLNVNGVPDYDGALYRIMFSAVTINFALCAFNLLPVPPLDGYNILKDSTLLDRTNPKLMWNVERYGQLVLLALLFTGVAGRYIAWAVGVLYGFGNWLLGPLLELL